MRYRKFDSISGATRGERNRIIVKANTVIIPSTATSIIT